MSDGPKIFLAHLREMIGRFDPAYFLPKYQEYEKRLKDSGLPIFCLSRWIESIDSGIGIYDLSDKAGWRYLNVNNIVSGGIDDTKSGFIATPPNFKDVNVIQRGDIITGRVGTIGVFVKYADDMPAYISDNVFRIRLKDCDPDYVLAVLNSSIVQNQIERTAKGSLQRVVNKQTIRNLKIPVPPPEVQSRIVAKLDAAYAAKRKADEKAAQLLASIDDIVLSELGIPKLPPQDTSLRARMFTVSATEVFENRADAYYHQDFYRRIVKDIVSDKGYVHLGQTGEFVRGVTYSSDDESETGIAILRANNVNLETGEIDLSDLVHVREDIVFDKSQQVRQGDILICAASGSKEHAGKVALVEESIDNTFAGGFMTILRVDESVALPQYVSVFMQSCLFRNLIMRHLGGTNINNVSLGILNQLPVIIPSDSIQRRIVEKVSAIREEAKRIKSCAAAALKIITNMIETELVGV